MQKSLLLFVIAMLPATAWPALEIEGVVDAVAQNVRAFVDLDREDCDAPRWRVQRRFRAMSRQSREALEPFGYYAPTIDTALDFGEECWTATLRIDAGPRVRFRSVDIGITGEAVDDPGFRVNAAERGLEPGAPLLHQAYEGFKSSLQVQAAERGYVEAAFTTARLDIWPEELAADVTLDFRSGPRYAFGDVYIEQEVVETELVARFLEFDAGTPYDGQQLADAYRALSNSGYFRSIQITPQFDRAEDGQIPISVLLTPARPATYSIGVGYATDSGLRFRADYRNRRINDRGHGVDVRLSLSSLLSGLFAEYRVPLANPRTEWLSYTGSIENKETDTSESDLFTSGVRRSTELRPTWLRTLSLDYRYERYTVADVEDTSRLLMPAIGFDNKKADDQLYPTRGRRIGVELRGAHDSFISTTSFAQLLGHARFVRSLGDDARVIARMNFGFTAKSEFDELPASVRFFAGGDESVRGYGYETLGPADDEGNVIGGSHLLVGSLEVERRMVRNFFGAAFVDAGNAFDTLDVDPAVGVGVGIKWRSPAGPLRFYVAHPLNKSDDDVRFHISLGADL